MKCKKKGGKPTTTRRRTTSRIKTKRTNTAAKQINGEREGEQSRSQQWARKMQRARGAHNAAHLLSHICLQMCVCVSALPGQLFPRQIWLLIRVQQQAKMAKIWLNLAIFKYRQLHTIQLFFISHQTFLRSKILATLASVAMLPLGFLHFQNLHLYACAVAADERIANKQKNRDDFKVKHSRA